MQKAKEIFSKFINKPLEEITSETVIDKRAVPGSVLIHRMYAALAKDGYYVSDMTSIKTYGDFEREITGEIRGRDATNLSAKTSLTNVSSNAELPQLASQCGNLDIGIDIEDIDNMPIVNDYREEPFYTANFSQREISYCILQHNPQASFAGKFAAKEALVKADNNLQKMPFCEIEILNNESGRPVFDGFSISISHSRTVAIAMAIKNNL
jgi:phosphopantetheinyl transferase (holo-ACP synthase)